jgi:hypothetical protein
MASEGSLPSILRPSRKEDLDEQLRGLLSSFDEPDGGRGVMRYWILYNRTSQGAVPAAENGHAGLLASLVMYLLSGAYLNRF